MRMIKHTRYVIANADGEIYSSEDDEFISGSGIDMSDCQYDTEQEAQNKIDYVTDRILGIMDWVRTKSRQQEYYRKQLDIWKNCKIHKVIAAYHCETLPSNFIENQV